MNNTRLKLSMTLVTAFMLSVAVPANADSAQVDLREVGSADCDQISALCLEFAEYAPEGLVPLNAVALGPYADAYPNGQSSSDFECIYIGSQNTSIIVERWLVWVEFGTVSGGSTNPIFGTNVPYPFVDTASGNACGGSPPSTTQILQRLKEITSPTYPSPTYL